MLHGIQVPLYYVEPAGHTQFPKETVYVESGQLQVLLISYIFPVQLWHVPSAKQSAQLATLQAMQDPFNGVKLAWQIQLLFTFVELGVHAQVLLESVKFPKQV